MIHLYEGSDKSFLKAYAKAKEENQPLKVRFPNPTRRQYRKWIQKRGAAFRASL